MGKEQINNLIGGIYMTDELLSTIREDIKRCEDAQTSKTGSYKLFQALMGKYTGLFPSFKADIPTSGKMTVEGEFDYRSELNAIKEKLEFIIISEAEKDPYYSFKTMLSDDIVSLKKYTDSFSTFEEKEMLSFYAQITAKYHPYVAKLGDGLYGYIPDYGIYEDVGNSSLEYNLKQLYNKLISFKALGYPSLNSLSSQNNTTPIVQITNTNTNSNSISISFNEAKKQIEEMSSLPETEIEEILNKTDELENIMNSKDRKSKKWDNCKNIIKWIADKGVDVGIAFLPLLMQIK